MVTAKRAQLLLASIYMVGMGGSSMQGRGTQSLGQLGKRDEEEAQTPTDCCSCCPNLQALAGRVRNGILSPYPQQPWDPMRWNEGEKVGYPLGLGPGVGRSQDLL